MNMIEKVAITLCEARTWPGAWHQANDVEKDVCRFEAKAAIEAMREPTEVMVRAGRIARMNVAGGYGGPSGWEAMINAGLEEK